MFTEILFDVRFSKGSRFMLFVILTYVINGVY